ncbi:MAG: PQQ-binding-like beta-propeller repeat protein [Myxococcota bacterium]|nr:PQQ-binding-like beta-propeller repeat protein [Myxococcota bacterium]
MLCLFASTALAAGGPGHWPSWRGPLQTGVAPTGDPPVTWGETANVRWKADIPGKGHSTPVIWGDRVFVTTAVPHGQRAPARGHDRHGDHDNMRAIQRHRFVVMALDRRNGQHLWQTVVLDEQPHEGTHVTGSWASASVVTDGERVYAFFGSRGLFALSWSGKVLWRVDLGDMHTKHGHGEGSSPALYGDTLVVNWDHEGASYTVGLDARTGGDRWRVDRDEVTSWSTPIVIAPALVPPSAPARAPQVIISATGRVRGYDITTGAELWACGGLSHNVVASPVYGQGLVHVMSSYETRAMLAIDLSRARGDLTATDAVVWRRSHDTPYVPSPVLTDGQLCFNRHLSGVMTCVNPRTGATLWGPKPLPGIRRMFASPIIAAGRIYAVGREGGGVVLKVGATFEVLARNRLDDAFSASPAVAEDALFLRGESHLYCLAAEGEAPGP